MPTDEPVPTHEPAPTPDRDLPLTDVPPLVLASGSRYRADVLAGEGIDVTIDPPEVDERALDPLLQRFGPDVLALRLAELKATAVAPRHRSSWLIAADQVAVLRDGERLRRLGKQPDPESAVEQLMSMSGTVHHLVGGLVIHDSDTGRTVSGTDVHRVRMRQYTRAEARAYVERFEPFDTAGTYRIEDAEEMAPGESLVAELSGESPTGVLGMPIPLMSRLLRRARLEWLQPEVDWTRTVADAG